MTAMPVEQPLLCNQCEQTSRGVGCSIGERPGVCGKDKDVESLQQILLYGLKGMASYAHHARRLGKTDEEVNAFIEEALFSTVTNVNFDVDSMLELVLKCGEINLKVMKMLDEGHVETYGKPRPTTVDHGTKAGPGILVTGHDMVDLHRLLKQVEGSNVNVYTHGEMLPAHMYPELGDHPNLAGHFGGPWQKQKTEFAAFPGAVLATTNCILLPRDTYKDRLFHTRVTAVPEGKKVPDDDFSMVIECAKQCEPCPENIEKQSTVGFHRTVILDKAAEIVEAVKGGNISHFFVIGGCDGAEPGRNYYSDYARATPEDSFILTLGCGKYRINGFDYGEHLGLPRLMDMGQCNDAYGAIAVAVALADAFDCSVNDLPLTIVLSWFEQKAVAVLLTLLSLGVQGVRIGPAAPAFISPNVMAKLQEAFNLQLIGPDGAADCAVAMAN
ncbi:hydroxylamine reductase [Novipirellula artificiosorum]|uniref:Hydroxylamine reductase n=1 Tax=Novipirellula artificiosorum TaxID=2528016 RepID=A0A5C6E0F4_9BACT|nr:hydroxylamine reductase [Novipirellula artificiosorum]TWU41974.1 Hydroxylamine reductase [Novipirellula artificiosorum]